MNIARPRKVTSLALAGALALTLSACSDDEKPAENGSSAAEETSAAEGSENTSDSNNASEIDESDMPTPIADLGVTGSLNGSGASSQQNAQQAWRDTFAANYGVTVNYNPTGSGTGREQFIAGSVSFAGTDSTLDEEELKAAGERCGSDVLELPLYISPIAVAYNLPGVDSLNLSGENIAKIFDGKITKWNDEALVKDNPDVELPDMQIVPVNRADDSGTSKNFQKYLAEAAPEAWTYEASDTWPISGTQSAERTSGVVDLTSQTEGAITYADASQIGELKAAKVEVDGAFLEYSPEAAAKIVDNSDPAEDATDKVLTVKLKRDGTVADAYPAVMVSYIVACSKYTDAQEAKNVKGYLSFMASHAGQNIATQAKGGNAPISDELRTKVMSAIDQIVTE